MHPQLLRLRCFSRRVHKVSLLGKGDDQMEITFEPNANNLNYAAVHEVWSVLVPSFQ